MEKIKAKGIEQYIALVYSEKSTLNNIQDLAERKKTACQRAKLNYDDESVQDIVNMKNKEVNEQITDYIIANNSNDFVLLISDQHLFWWIQQRLMDPPKSGEDEEADITKKTKMSIQGGELLIRIKERQKIVFGNDALIQVAIQKVKHRRYEDRLKEKKK